MPSELYAYTISAHVKRDPNQQLRLDDLHGDGGGGDLLNTFDSTISVGAEWPPPPSDPNAEDTRRRVLRVEEVHTEQGDARVRYGRVRVTRHAIRHDVEQAGTGQIIRITDDDLEGRPLFFWIAVPSRSTNALLLTERRARFGIVNLFWKSLLVDKLRQTYSDATFDLAYYVPRAVWDEYLASGEAVEGAVLRRVIEEQDETQDQNRPSRRRVIATITSSIERRIVPERRIVARILRDRDTAGAMEILLGEHADDVLDVDDYDSVKVKLQVSGKHRTVELGRERFAQIGYTAEGVPVDDEGYPQLEGMKDFAVGVARDIGGPLGIR